MVMAVALFTHSDMLEHRPGAGHPERSERLAAVIDALADRRLDRREANEASVADLERIHPPTYVSRLLNASPATGVVQLDPDTVLKRGYVRVTGPDGRTLTDRVEAAREAVLTLKFRDGDLAVSTGDAPPRPSSSAPRPKPSKKGTAPAQDDLFG